MPLQSVEELRYVKHQLKKRYGKYNEEVICAEYVQLKGKKKGKKRLLVVGKHRLYTFRPNTRFQSDLSTDNHWYDMINFNFMDKTRLVIQFRKSKQQVAQIDICAFNMPIIVQAICLSYSKVTLGYNEELCCKFSFFSEDELLPLPPLSEQVVAGGIVEAYEAQSCYFQVYFSRDVVRLLESIYNKNQFSLDLSDCPLVEKPKVMLPLVGALRHNTYFLSLKLTECQGNQQILLMIANILRFNTTLTKFELSNLDSPSTYEVLGTSLKANTNHAIQVIDISNNKVPSQAIQTLSESFEIFSHALQSLRLNNCQLSFKSFSLLFNSFKKNYGMSLTIQQFDISNNRLGSKGSALLGNWMNRIREDSNLEHLYIRNTNLAFIFIGRALVHYPTLRSLDLSKNKLDTPSVQLLTLWLETSTQLQSINLSDCSITGEHIKKILSVMLCNRNLTNVSVHLDHNDLKKESDCMLIVDALKRGSNIHTLTLSRNRLKSTVFISILDALQKHSSLHTLVLDQCYKSSADSSRNTITATALAMLINQNRNIRALSLSGSYQSIIPTFIQLLNPNAALEELDISRNQLKDIGASEITNNLRNNENIKYLHIDDNQISYTGWQIILQIFSTNNKLETIPFPWIDYHRLGVKKGTIEETKVRKIIVDIQHMCSLNFKNNDSCIDTVIYSLSSKSTIHINFDAPTQVSPLAMVPEDIVDDDDFTFANDSSEEGITEMELGKLQNKYEELDEKRNSTRFNVNNDSSEEDDIFNDNYDEKPELPTRDYEENDDNLTLSHKSIFPVNKKPPLPVREEISDNDTITGNIPPLPPRDDDDDDDNIILNLTKHDIPPREFCEEGTPPSLPPRDNDNNNNDNNDINSTNKSTSLENIPKAPSIDKFNEKSQKENKRKKIIVSVPNIDNYEFSDNDESSEEITRPQSEILSSGCDSIGELLSKVMGTRREFIDKDNSSEEDSYDEYSSDDDSW